MRRPLAGGLRSVGKRAATLRQRLSECRKTRGDPSPGTFRVSENARRPLAGDFQSVGKYVARGRRTFCTFSEECFMPYLYYLIQQHVSFCNFGRNLETEKAHKSCIILQLTLPLHYETKDNRIRKILQRLPFYVRRKGSAESQIRLVVIGNRGQDACEIHKSHTRRFV